MIRLNAENIFWRIKDKRFHLINEYGTQLIGQTDAGISWLAGGALRGLVDKNDVICDFDLFFSTHLRSVEVALNLEELGFEMIFNCPQGLLKTFRKTLEPDFNNLAVDRSGSNIIKIQLITKDFYLYVEDLLHSFDINAGRFAYEGKNVYTDRAAISSAKKRVITLHNVTHPNATFKRILKYRDKGYAVTNEAIDFFTQRVYDMGYLNQELQKQFYVD